MTKEQINDDKAKGIFAGLMTIGAGGPGLVVAGLVLALDYLLHGEPDQREQLAKARAKRNRAYYDEAMAWVEADRKAREAHRKALRDWYANTETDRGDRPANPEDGPGRAARWLWSWLLIGFGRAKRGWKKGRERAREQRDAGQDQWWKVNDPVGDADPEPEPEPVQTETPDRPATVDEPVATDQDRVDIPLDEVVDAEIIDDLPKPDATGPDDPGAAKEFAERLERLRAEAEQTMATNPADTTQPRKALA